MKNQEGNLSYVLGEPNHTKMMQDVLKVNETYLGKLSRPEMLAVLSQCVGMLVAVQDPKAMSPQDAMKMVEINIQLGNDAVVLGTGKIKGSA